MRELIQGFVLGAIFASSIWSAVLSANNVEHMRAYNDLTTRWQALIGVRP